MNLDQISADIHGLNGHFILAFKKLFCYADLLFDKLKHTQLEVTGDYRAPFQLHVDLCNDDGLCKTGVCRPISQPQADGVFIHGFLPQGFYFSWGLANYHLAEVSSDIT